MKSQQRKVIQSNPTTLVLSLPKQWTKAKGIEKGDSLKVTESESGDLTISLNQQNNRKSIEFTLKKNYQPAISSQLRNLYMLGYDTLHIGLEDESQIPLITDAIEPLIGFEIVEETEKRCVVAHVANDTLETHKQFTFKIYHIISEMITAAERAIMGEQQEDDTKVIEYSFKECSKLTSYCRRVLKKFDLTGTDEGLIMFNILTLSHMLSNSIYFAYPEFLKTDKASKEFKIYSQKVCEVVRQTCKLFRTPTNYNLHQTANKLLYEDQIKTNEDNYLALKRLHEIARLVHPLFAKLNVLHFIREHNQ